MTENLEIIIGRESNTKISDPYVSKQHAKIIKTKDGLYIEDLNSTGGTFVNGKRIQRKKISISDKIVLGKEYSLDISTILSQIPIYDDEYRDSFFLLKEVYDNYNKNRLKIQSQSQGKMMIKRSVPMAIPGVLVATSSLIPGIGPAAAILGGGFSAIAIIAGSIWSAKEQQKIPEKLFELDEQLKIDYSCPDCKKPFGQHNSWESLKRQGQCPFCRRKFNP